MANDHRLASGRWEKGTCKYKLLKNGRINFDWMSLQVYEKSRTSTDEVLNQFDTGNHSIQQIIIAICDQ